jgi:hypothetical protein
MAIPEKARAANIRTIMEAAPIVADFTFYRYEFNLRKNP